MTQDKATDKLQIKQSVMKVLCEIVNVLAKQHTHCNGEREREGEREGAYLISHTIWQVRVRIGAKGGDGLLP